MPSQLGHTMHLVFVLALVLELGCTNNSAAPLPQASVSHPVVAERGDDLDRKVIGILQAKCVKCHDDLKGSAGAGINNLLKLDELASGYGDVKQPEKSELYRLIASSSPRMPKARMNNIEWNGPLAEAEKVTILDWLKRGGPSETYRHANDAKSRTLISESERLARIASDLDSLERDSREQARYLTLTNWHNHQSVANHELEQLRHGLVKLLNSVSRSSQVLGLDTAKAEHRVVAVDRERTIFRLDLRHLGWTKTDWDKVAQHDLSAFVLPSKDGLKIAQATSSELPFLRADWFVFVASQPPLYHELAGLPATLTELEKSLGIDRLKAIRDQKVARAGFDHSRVSVNNRLLERIALPSRNGGYHLSYDFASNTGNQNLKDNPLGPDGALETKFAFRHDGGEVIFTLANGFQGYLLVAATGQRIDTAPQAIVSDSTMPGGVIINGVSCISCHDQGMNPQRGDARLKSLDEIGSAAAVNFRRFNEAERLSIAALYPSHEQFEKLLEQDRVRFLSALAEAGIEQRGSDEPVRLLFDRFTRDVDLNMVAADFGLSPDECREKLKLEGETRQLLERLERGGLKRQLYLTEFRTIARLIGAGDLRDFVKLPSPFFGEKIEVAQPATPPADKPLLGQTGVDVLDAENRNGKLQVQLQIEDNQRSFNEGDSIRFRVRANEDCFLTILTVDPTGEVVQLLPNALHPKLQLKGGQTVTLPTEEMVEKFDFAAQPPHGLSEVKVIATKQPLRLAAADANAIREKKLPPFGNVKAGAKAIGIRLKPNIPDPAQPGAEIAADKLDQLLAPDQWATAIVTFVTRELKK